MIRLKHTQLKLLTTQAGQVIEPDQKDHQLNDNCLDYHSCDGFNCKRNDFSLSPHNMSVKYCNLECNMETGPLGWPTHYFIMDVQSQQINIAFHRLCCCCLCMWWRPWWMCLTAFLSVCCQYMSDYTCLFVPTVVKYPGGVVLS